MGKWEKVRLGDVCEVVSGTTPKSDVEKYWNGTQNWVTPAELTKDIVEITETDRKITELAIKESSLKPFPAGTVLLSSRAPIGKVAIAGTSMYCNQGFKNLVCSAHIINKYLYWFLKGKTDYLNSLGRGATFKEISKAIVQSIELPLPPLDEQKCIAKNLDLASEIVKGYKEQLAELDKLVQSVFYEMFGDPVTNEKGWAIGTIRDIVREVKYGTSRPATKDGKYPYLRMNNITSNGHLDLSNLKQIDIPDNELEKCMVTYGDVLFNRTNSKELVGKTCVYNLQTKMVIAGYIIRVRVNEKMIPEFLSAILNSQYGKNTLYGMCKSIIGQANINAQELQNINIYVPPIQLQTRFASIVTEIEAQKAQIQQALTQAENLFNSLMQEYFE